MKIRSPLRSLQGRLLVASTLVLPVVLLLAGFALKNAYSSSLETAVKDRLQLQVYLLLGSVELKEEHIRFPESLHEPRYEKVGSGLYAAIHDKEGSLLWRSLSSTLMDDQQLSQKVDTGFMPAGMPRFKHLTNDGLYQYQLRIIWEQAQQERSMLFTVMESDDQVKRDISAYTDQLALWLSIIFLVALLAQTLILGWGLRPLKRLAKDLKGIEQGQSTSLQGNYPNEVEVVTDNLNGLIESEREQRERYRNTLADLAHSLKTPLAVVRGAANEEHSYADYKALIGEQVERMDQIVQYQLTRAVKSQGKPLGQSIPIKPVVERITNALSKVYREKQISAQIDISDNLTFPGDERDLMELLGNILENAFKYGCHRVTFSASATNGRLNIRICDDGPGVEEDQRQVIIKRGERLDNSIQGQGIGLAVSTDIISSYNGQLEITESPLGGCCFLIELPLG